MSRIPYPRFAKIWILLILLVPLVILLPGIGGFAYPPQETAYSDITVSHYPNAVFLRNTIIQEHTIPLWSPAILSGYPFAANPLSGLWYPIGWIALILPLPLGFNLLVVFHLLFGGIGMWLFLRQQGLSELAALFGGLAFESMPKLFAHYGAGHITLLYAIAWTPWLLLCSARKDKDDFPSIRSRFRMGPFPPGVIYALVVLADVRWAAYAGVLWWGFTVAQSYWLGRFSGVKSTVLPLLTQTVLGFLLAAPSILPLLEYTQLSTRAALTTNESMAFSLPPARLLGLIYPAFKGYHEWVLYPGLVTLILGLSGLGWSSRRHANWFWLVVSCASLVLSLGLYLPGIPLLASLPGFDLLRVPSRMLFITGISLAVVSADNLDRLLIKINPVERHRSALVLVCLLGFIVFLAIGIRLLSGGLAMSFVWGTGVSLIGILWFVLYLKDRLSSGLWFAGLIVVSVIDLGVVDKSLFTTRSTELVLSEAQSESRYLTAQLGEFRVYSPSYSLPQQVSALSGIEMASGVDPLQLKSYVDFITRASGVPRHGYNVGVPPLEGDNPTIANADYLPDPKLLGLLNVKYVLAGFSLNVNGLSLVEQNRSTWLYQNIQAQPRAWVQPADAPLGEGVLQVRWIKSTPNRITLEAVGPGLLVLSEVSYPGWKAWVDNQPVTIIESMGLFRSIELAPGSHLVEFAYRPASVYAGLGLFSIGLLLVFVLCWANRR